MATRWTTPSTSVDLVFDRRRIHVAPDPLGATAVTAAMPVAYFVLSPTTPGATTIGGSPVRRCPSLPPRRPPLPWPMLPVSALVVPVFVLVVGGFSLWRRLSRQWRRRQLRRLLGAVAISSYPYQPRWRAGASDAGCRGDGRCGGGDGGGEDGDEGGACGLIRMTGTCGLRQRPLLLLPVVLAGPTTLIMGGVEAAMAGSTSLVPGGHTPRKPHNAPVARVVKYSRSFISTIHRRDAFVRPPNSNPHN